MRVRVAWRGHFVQAATAAAIFSSVSRPGGIGSGARGPAGAVDRVRDAGGSAGDGGADNGGGAGGDGDADGGGDGEPPATEKPPSDAVKQVFSGRLHFLKIGKNDTIAAMITLLSMPKPTHTRTSLARCWMPSVDASASIENLEAHVLGSQIAMRGNR